MIAFNKYYNQFNILSLSLVVISLLFLIFKGLNFGIDFKGGILIELRSTDSKVNVSSLRDKFNQMDLGDVSVKKFGNETDYLIKFENKDNKKNIIEDVKKSLDKSFGNNIDFRRVENVGPKVSAELLKSGIIAISVALALMLIYIWIRFEWQFSLGAILALFHDVIVTLGVFSLFSLEINLSIIAAVLTIVGYSMNDTVVIFDRVRENLRKYSDIKIFELTNISINETLSRTIITSATTLLALLAIYFFGGEILKGFSLAMILGVVFGTYSSIYIANTVLVRLRVSQKTVLREDDQNKLNACGIYHMSTLGETSWYKFGCYLLKQYKRKKNIENTPSILSTSSQDLSLKAARPKYSVLNTEKLVRQFELDLPSWQHYADRYINSKI